MPRLILGTTRYLRRHLIKIAIFGSAFVFLMIYFQSVMDQNNHAMDPQPQNIRFQAHEGSSVKKSDIQVVDLRRHLQKENSLHVDASRENVHIPGDDSLRLNKPNVRNDLHVSKHVKPVLQNDVQIPHVHVADDRSRVEDGESDVFENGKYQKAPLKLNNSSSDLTANDQKLQQNKINQYSSNTHKDIASVEDVINLQRENNKRVAESRAQEKVGVRKDSPSRRRNLNNDHHILNSNDYKKRVPLSQKSAQVSSKPQIRIMPKRPAVPEGHSLMITCADVLVLGRKKTTEEAMYMTFKLPETLPKKLTHLVHIIVRPGMVTLRFSHIKKGHAGVYKCYAEDKSGNKYSYDVEVEVLDRVDDDKDDDLEQNHRELESEFAGEAQVKEMKRYMSNEHFKRIRERKWAKMGMMDAYEYDYDRVSDIVEQIHGHEGAPPSVNLTSLTDRGKFQQGQIDQFCERRGLGDLAYSVPDEEEGGYSFNRHILVNDKARTLFCFLPKAGCTNLKVLFFVVQGFIPLSQLLEPRDRVNQKRIEDVQLQESFLNRNEFNREFALKHYFKFMMVRNPLHRLVSGYRSKVQRYPLTGLNDSKPHYNFLRKAIYLTIHPKDYAHYLKMRGKVEINITFSDFIDYWLLQRDDVRYDEHFRSMFKICQPCRARFDFYANFKHFEEDTQILVDKINSRPEFIRAGYYDEGDSTELLSPSYYAQLTEDQKMAVLKQMELDLDFYYHLFPREKGVHNTILGLDKHVPVPLLS